MKNIEFLPPEYRHKQAIQRARLWWVTIALLFGTGIGLATVTQFGLRFQLQRQLTQFDHEYQSAMIHRAELEATQKRLLEAEQEANFYASLRQPWRKSQVLAALLNSLPPKIRLREIQSSAETNATGPAITAVAASATVETAAPIATNSFQADFQALQSLSENNPLQYILQGTAPSPEELHFFVAQLDQQRLIGDVELQSVESVTLPSGEAITQFQIRIKVRPGLGQPGGPTAPASDSTPSVPTAPTGPTTPSQAGTDVARIEQGATIQ